jgi:hypothetical protein
VQLLQEEQPLAEWAQGKQQRTKLLQGKQYEVQLFQKEQPMEKEVTLGEVPLETLVLPLKEVEKGKGATLF